MADNDNDDGDETRVSSWFVNFEEEEATYVSVNHGFICWRCKVTIKAIEDN